ncbi:MAG: FHA domain-containing protein [Chloroflexota bacterium]
MPRLKMLRGPDVGTVYELDKSTVSIGRGQKNTIIIQDNEVSRNHCRLVRVLDDYEIHDLNSTNGTFVNGQRVDEGGWLLSGRCIVEIGDSITLEYTPTDVALGTSPPLEPPQELIERVFYLVIEQQSLDQPEIYVLDRPILNIGRDVDNEITLREPEVSRHHMRLVLTDDGYTLEDLNTVNGTELNGMPLQRQSTLSNDDVITVGKGLKMWYTNDPTSLLEDQAPADDGDTVFNDAYVDDTKDNREALLKETDLKIQIGHGLEHGDLERSLFLLYAREEWNVIGRHLYAFLTDNNVETFSEQYLTPDTDNWQDAMEQALAESPCMLAVISDKSIATPHVGRYIRHFLAREKAVLLLRYGKVSKMPMVLKNMPAIRFDPKNPEKTFRMILAELRRIGL